MDKDLAGYEYIPIIFWIGHLVIALIGLVLLRRRARKVPSTRRSAYFVVGGLLILVGLFPAALASMFTVGIALGAIANAKAPTGLPLAVALASPLGLLSAFVVVYIIVRATTFMFARVGAPGGPSNEVTLS